MENKKIRLGIIGIGNMGTVHAKNIVEGKCPDFVLTAVADVKAERLTWAKEFVTDVACYSDAIEMLDSGKIDACIVAVPHYDHARYAMECMKRGIHVMVEKPAGVYTQQVKEMNEEAKKHPEVVFGMMFNQRTSKTYQKMRELVQSGKYGNIRRVNWLITSWYRTQYYYDSGDWRATWSGEGGGVLMNQCPHQLDLVQWICGMPVKVQTKMHFGKWHDIEVEDDVTTYMEYENGATGVFITSTGDGWGSNRFEIQMDKARIVEDWGKLTVLEYDMTEQEFSKTTTKMSGIPCHEVEIEYDETDESKEGHVGVLNAWGGAILRGTPLVADGSEGINGLTLANAMYLSAFLDKEVSIPFDEELYYNELMKRVATSRRKEKKESVVIDLENSY